MKNIFIVILHYGDLKITRNCIRSLEKNEEYPFKLVLVNNNASNLSLKELAFEKIKIINNKKNLGFAGGVNIGISYSLKQGAEKILLLNNDTIINKPFINSLINVFNKFSNVGIVGPAICFKKNGKVIYDVGGKMNKLIGRTSHTEVDKIYDSKLYFPDYITGAAMLIRKEVFEKIGLFDENFFLYYEDVDFCLRAKKEHYKAIVDTSVIIEHLLSKSVGKESGLAIYQQTRSSIIFGRKYFTSFFSLMINRLFIFYQTCVFFIKDPIKGINGFVAIKDYMFSK